MHSLTYRFCATQNPPYRKPPIEVNKQVTLYTVNVEHGSLSSEQYEIKTPAKHSYKLEKPWMKN